MRNSNAYFYGFGTNKRVVLYDTLNPTLLRVATEQTDPHHDVAPDATDKPTPNRHEVRCDLSLRYTHTHAVCRSRALSHVHLNLPVGWPQDTHTCTRARVHVHMRLHTCISTSL